MIKPDSWYSNIPGKYAGYYIIRNITSIYYIVDGGERQNVTVNDAGSLTNGYPNTSPKQTLSFSLTLDLAAGQHRVEVGVDVESYYIASQLTARSSSTTVNGSSEPIDFDLVLPTLPTLAPQSTINTPTEALTPTFPVTVVVAAIAAVFGVSAGVGLLVYRKKSKLPKADQNP